MIGGPVAHPVAQFEASTSVRLSCETGKMDFKKMKKRKKQQLLLVT